MQPGESLTSLVCRQSRACLMTPRQLFTAMNLRTCSQIGDLDTEMDKNLLIALSIRLGIEVETLRKGLLDDYQSKFLNPIFLEIQKGRGRLPRHRQWILANGWQRNPWQKMRRPGGIPYCPLCFKENNDPWFPLFHRFCTTLVCERHRVILVDECPRCFNPISPYTIHENGDWTLRTDRPLCIHCLGDDNHLCSINNHKTKIEPAPIELLRIQEYFLQALQGNRVYVPQVGEMSAVRFMAGVRHCLTAANYLLGLGLEARDGIESMFRSAQPPLLRDNRQPSIEFLPIGERMRRLLWFEWIIRAPLDRWHLLLAIPGAPMVMLRKCRHPWELIGEDGIPLEKTSSFARSYRKHEINPIGMVTKFFDIVNNLGLTHDVVRSLLGGISEKKYQNWRRLPSLRIPAQSHHRMEHFVRIWDGVVDLTSSTDAAKRWMLRKNRHPSMLGLPPVYFLARDPDGNRFEAVSRILGRMAFSPEK